jgi:leucyl-tRNA synthetase
MGFDAFGLPAEQYAIATGIHPSITTRKAMDTFRGQLKRFGFCIDWSREFATIDEDYYKWTQWIWLRAYHAWYDPRPRTLNQHGKARPIDDLIAELEAGDIRIGPENELVFDGDRGFDAARVWADLDDAAQRAFIDNHRLAYLAEQMVNWCPKLGTALANEEVIDGKSERGKFPVYRKPLKQWMFRITAYAERLLKGLDELDWPESTRAMQTQWIGRSEGASIDFPIESPPRPDEFHTLRVFTTRPDTIFGATYMVIAPEHPLVAQIIAKPATETDVAALKAYIEKAKTRSEVDRMAEMKEKTGVPTGLYAINPANEQRIGIWVADYVLMGYGTGAIMAVPGQDQRDWDFARAFDLPIVRTVEPPEDFTGEAYLGDGPAINSGFLDGLHIADAKTKIIAWLEASGGGGGKGTIQYKLRDWLFSRQRYWGEPFPIVHTADGRCWPVMESALPVKLPPLEDFTPEESDEPKPLLAKATEWVNTTAGEAGVDPALLPPDTPVKRETNTMPNWAGSCWYHLRYCAPGCKDRFTERAAEQYWMDGNGVDLYIGGAEHAVLHLLYARFWQMILYDLGEVSTPEPYRRLFHQGMITSFAYMREDKTLAPLDAVEERADGTCIERATGQAVTKTIAKMSKSLHNVINPDDVISEYGADTFRLYEMYMGPLEASIPWNPRDIVGVFRFLQRAWRLAVDEDTGDLTLREEPDSAIERALHRTIAKVGADIDKLAMNTAIAALIEFVNAATSAGSTHAGPDACPGVGRSGSESPSSGSAITRDQLERFAIILSPFAPHICEELWHKLGHETSIVDAAWPAFDAAMMVDDQIEIPVQIMGKVRGRIFIPREADTKTTEAAALADDAIKAQLAGKIVRKVIVVPGKIVNIVAS